MTSVLFVGSLPVLVADLGGIEGDAGDLAEAAATAGLRGEPPLDLVAPPSALAAGHR